MNAEIEVFVSIAGKDVLAGRLYAHHRRNKESASFVYDDRYLANPSAYALDPLLPLSTTTSQTPAGQLLFGAFADCCPDRWGRTLIARAERMRAKHEDTTPQAMSEVGYLLGVRDDLRQGALRFRRGPDEPFLATDTQGVPALADLPELLELAQRAETDRAEYDELRRLIRVGSSLGGARPKAHVRTPEGRVAIAKFPSDSADTWNVMAWEKVALDLAAAAGVQVPTSSLLRIADRRVLIVDRFDRTAQGERIGYVSAMTVLEARDGSTGSYLDIAGIIETRSAAASAELLQLWRRIAFSVLISNTDDHLRNHGFLHVRGDTWQLAPAFDLNPNPEPGAKHLRTAINEVETAASVDLLMEVAPAFRLSPDAAAGVLSAVAHAVSQWQTVANRHGLSTREINEMSPAFEHPAADQARALPLA